MVYQDVVRCKTLSPESKAIYAYLASFAGKDDTCYPTLEMMWEEMGMGKNRFSKYMNELITMGIVEKTRERNGNLYGKNVYRITHEVRITENGDFRLLQNKEVGFDEVQNREVQYEETNNNSIKNNSYKNNSININYQLIADMYNDTCVSFPKVTKLSDARKRGIKARLRIYTVDDFKRLFEMAEGSSFLKGQNNRNWSADFDWLIKDANMAKVLDGNYADNGQRAAVPQKKSGDYMTDEELLAKYCTGETSPDDPFQ